MEGTRDECGVGRVDRQDDCVDHYLQETQASSSNKKVDSKEIVELRQQIQDMNSRFQSFQDFMIQYLPPEAVAVAQHIFQQSNTPQPTQHNQLQDNDEVQHDSNHDEQQNLPGQDYNNY